MPDVGDWVPLTLTVSPADETTTATVTAQLLPDGATSTLTATPNTGRDTWTAQFFISALGAWRVAWTVTGTGQGVQYDTVYAVGGPDPAAGTSYATLAELAAYLRDTPPDGAGALLERASVDVDTVLIGAWYAVDDDGLPTAAAVIEALSRATCAQVHYWMESGNTSGVDTAGGWRDVSIGNVRLSRVSGGSGTEGAGAEFAPAAAKILRLAGLLPISPMVYG